MEDKTRRSTRVQDAWAGPNRGSPKCGTRPRSSRESGCARPIWTNTVLDYPETSLHTKGSMSVGGFKFEQPNEDDIPKDKKLQVITKPGIYEISTEPSGISRLRLFQLYSTEEADALFARLSSDLPWMEMAYVQSNVTIVEPRLMAWYGDYPYSYAGITHSASQEWPDVLLAIRKCLEDSVGLSFNSVLCNLYRTGKDHVAWHSDDESALGLNPVIASFSFGDCRNFELRKKPSQVSADRPGDITYTEFIKMPLTHGSLLLMEGCVQSDWQHRVPSEYHDKKPRINLTFRNIGPEPSR